MNETNNSMYGRSRSIPVEVSKKGIDLNLSFPGKSILPFNMDVYPVNNNKMMGMVEATPVTKFVKVMTSDNDTYVRSSVPLLSYYDKATIKAGTLGEDIYKAYISFVDLAVQDDMIKKGLLKAELVFTNTAESTANNIHLYALDKTFEENNINYNIDLGYASYICKADNINNTYVFDITSYMRSVMKGDIVDKGFGFTCDDGLMDVYSNNSTVNQPKLILTYYDSSKNHRVESMFGSIKTMVQPVFETFASIDIEQDKTEILGSIGVLANGFENINASLEAEEPIHYKYTQIFASLETQKDILTESVTVNASIEIEQDKTELSASISLYGEDESLASGYVTILEPDVSTKPIGLTLVKQDIESIPLKVDIIHVSTITGCIYYEQENCSTLDGYVNFIDEKTNNIEGVVTLVEDISKAINGKVVFTDNKEVTKPMGLVLIKQDIVSKDVTIDFRVCSQIHGRVAMLEDADTSVEGNVLFVGENTSELSGAVNFMQDGADEQSGSVTFMQEKTSKVNGIVSYTVDVTKAISGKVNFMKEIEETLDGFVGFTTTDTSKVSGIVSYEVNNMRFIDGSVVFVTNHSNEIEGVVSYSLEDKSELTGSVIFIDELDSTISGSVVMVSDLSEEFNGSVTMVEDLTDNIQGSVAMTDDQSMLIEGGLTMVEDVTKAINGKVTFLDEDKKHINGTLMMELSHGVSTYPIEFVYSKSYMTIRIIEN